MWYLVGVLMAINVGLIVYFIWTFERLFIIMKAGSLKDLLNYKQQVGKTPAPAQEEYMP